MFSIDFPSGIEADNGDFDIVINLIKFRIKDNVIIFQLIDSWHPRRLAYEGLNKSRTITGMMFHRSRRNGDGPK
jgi:hypothetical protein